MQRVELDTVKGQISDLIESALQGEEIVITQADQPILKLVRIEPKVTQRKRGSAKGMVHMTEDFDAPWDVFLIGTIYGDTPKITANSDGSGTVGE